LKSIELLLQCDQVYRWLFHYLFFMRFSCILTIAVPFINCQHTRLLSFVLVIHCRHTTLYCPSCLWFTVDTQHCFACDSSQHYCSLCSSTHNTVVLVIPHNTTVCCARRHNTVVFVIPHNTTVCCARRHSTLLCFWFHITLQLYCPLCLSASTQHCCVHDSTIHCTVHCACRHTALLCLWFRPTLYCPLCLSTLNTVLYNSFGQIQCI